MFQGTVAVLQIGRTKITAGAYKFGIVKSLFDMPVGTSSSLLEIVGESVAMLQKTLADISALAIVVNEPTNTADGLTRLLDGRFKGQTLNAAGLESFFDWPVYIRGGLAASAEMLLHPAQLQPVLLRGQNVPAQHRYLFVQCGADLGCAWAARNEELPAGMVHQMALSQGTTFYGGGFEEMLSGRFNFGRLLEGVKGRHKLPEPIAENDDRLASVVAAFVANQPKSGFATAFVELYAPALAEFLQLSFLASCCTHIMLHSDDPNFARLLAYIVGTPQFNEKPSVGELGDVYQATPISQLSQPDLAHQGGYAYACRMMHTEPYPES